MTASRRRRPHRGVLEGDGGELHVPVHGDGVHLLQRDAVFELHEEATVDVQLPTEDRRRVSWGGLEDGAAVVAARTWKES